MEVRLSESPADEERFALLVSRLTERMQAGEELQLSQVVIENSEFADQLHEIWGMIVVTDLAASEARQSSSENWQAPTVRHTKSVSLPARVGDYELQEVLGRGGMGVVYQARQVSLNRLVALKMIQENRPADQEHHARFFKEAEATARLQHPGIVPVYEVGEYEGQPFFTMQLIRGQTLAARLREGPLSQRQAAAILIEVSRAIHYAHTCGILHRDIKPSNIMIEEGGRVCVTDFGLAKLIDSQDSLTRTGATVGTPSYMAPEQAAGRWGQVSVRSDVYSLGAVLYHTLTGRPPFIADSPIHLAMQILEHDPAPVRFLEPSIDRDLEMIVARSIQKPPDLRYASAEALADDLESFQRDEPVAARSGRLSEVVARWFRETHHATVLENWGLLWIWHSLVLLTVSFMTQWMYWQNVQSRLSYASLWTVGLGAWAAVFWALRRRMGPVTFVERQIAHIWGASLFCIAALAPLEGLLDLDPLTLSPILPLIGSMVFLAKAGILSGQFYVQALIMLSTSFVMAVYPKFAHLIFGIIAAGCFFVPGLKYYKQRRLSESDRL